MESLKTYKLNKSGSFGFTLIEVLIVVAILSVIMSLGLFLSFDSYRGYVFLTERDKIVNLLGKARNQALINKYGAPHGACYDAQKSEYILFSGSLFDISNQNNEIISGNKIVQISDFPQCESGNEIIFSALSARTSDNQISITGGRKDFIITINNEGGIIW